MNIYRNRRSRLAESISEGVIIVPTSPEMARNANQYYEFRWDSTFYYLTGFKEPDAVLVIVPGKKPRQILFCRDKNVEREIWDGFRYGPKAAKTEFGFDEAYSIDEIDERVPELLINSDVLHTPMAVHPAWDARVANWLTRVRGLVRTGINAPMEVHDIRARVGEMRLFKDAEEVKIMKRAADISSAAHVRAMREAQTAKFEYEIAAGLAHEFGRHGAGSAYGSIVGAGANACCLHYRSNDGPLKKGELLLIDAGCELGSYASDITRTFPIGGKFSPAQRDVYEVVYAAQKAAIAAIKPGVVFDTYHEVAKKELVRGLIDLKLCKGSVDEVLEKKTYEQFYMHKAGHWLGLDVHDAGEYLRKGKYRKFEPGMVLTVEPGLYIRPAANVPKAFNNIGVRIEDDVLVTKKGCEELSTGVPKKLKDVEAACRA
ncbi:aminopeptidase P N-terminal domain-containing protein [Usitatibacter palustris]|uniref:Xaa-Pro aminopeptidase n=1 Tax=Usitatibacter palustris TaxID=2732487 RepID=A0A6M4H9E8_9PROT|nr:aminopeptidase P N-terminal domain-containing protein [Usitatibacter palustris]QJR15343.1 Xaa-Pro aminopeptidase [Usitatibacter palustris]